jgi:hypothetical protein
VQAVASARSTSTVQFISGEPMRGVIGMMYQTTWLAAFHPHVNQRFEAPGPSVPVH